MLNVEEIFKKKKFYLVITALFSAFIYIVF